MRLSFVNLAFARPNDGVPPIFEVGDIEEAKLVACSIGKRHAHYMTASYSEGNETHFEPIAAFDRMNVDEIMRLPDDRQRD